MSFAAQVAGLKKAVVNCCDAHGVGNASAGGKAATLLLAWTAAVQANWLTGVADELILGARCAIIETSGCLALGLARPAIFSIRAQMDLLLSWCYFKDHPIEWARVQYSGDGFMLKKDVFRYLDEHTPGFGYRWSLLLRNKTRTVDDPYKILSAHVHGQSINTTPKATALDAMIADQAVVAEVVSLQAEVAEMISDLLVSAYCSDWAAMPVEISNSLKVRFRASDQKKLYRGSEKATT